MQVALAAAGASADFLAATSPKSKPRPSISAATLLRTPSLVLKFRGFGIPCFVNRYFDETGRILLEVNRYCKTLRVCEFTFYEKDLRGEQEEVCFWNGAAARLLAGAAGQGIGAEVLDSYLILFHRVKKLNIASLTRQEKTHETSSQDLDPDVWTSGHVRSSRRSAGSRPGRRADTRVPTSTTTARQMRSTTTDDEVVVNRRWKLTAR